MIRMVADARDTSRVRQLARRFAQTGGRLNAHVGSFLWKWGEALRESRTRAALRRLAKPALTATHRTGTAARSSLVVASFKRAGCQGLGIAFVVGVLTNSVLVLAAKETVGLPGWVLRGALLTAGAALLSGVVTSPMLREGRLYRWLFLPRPPGRNTSSGG